MEYFLMDMPQRERTDGHSSKGNQWKWMQNSRWYKADYMGYEALAEILVSRLLEYSDTDYFVRYEPVEIFYRDQMWNGCVSDHFLNEGEELVTIDHLYRQYTGRDLSQVLAGLSEVEERIAYLVNFVEELTGISQFGQYLTVQLTIDAFFLNEDRHTNNMAVIYRPKEDEFRLCPYFDHGLSLLADTKVDFGLEIPWEKCIEKIEAKPFCRNFHDQLDAAEKLYPISFQLHFERKTIQNEVKKFAGIYEERILNRVESVLLEQRRKYRYLF